MNRANSLKRPAPPRRLLGEARRESAEAAHIAASKRRRLADADHGNDDDDDDNENDPDENPGPVRAAVSSGALGDDDVAVFADAVYDDDDKEADLIYEQVDLRMQSRRQKQREHILQQQLAEYREANPTVRQQFADLKAGLNTVSADEWAAIPDIGDYSVKKQRFQKFTPLPDSLLERAYQENAVVGADASNATATTDLAALGAGRTSVLEHNLDAVNPKSAAIRNPVDHDGYLSAMTGTNITSDSNIADIKKTRHLLKSVTTTNPTHAPGWIASTRLEEQAGKMSVARSIALDGCRKCPNDPEMWIEAARVHPPNIGRRILARAIRSVPKSLHVWIAAADIETEVKSKRRVLRKALEILPRSGELWQAAVELEEPEGARILLSRAVECVPLNIDLWLALAKLENYARAKDVLRRAAAANPRAIEVVITQAQLEEAQHGQDATEIDEVVERGVASLMNGKSEVTRESWLEQAELMDEAGFVGTVDAIVRTTSDIGLAVGEREKMWVRDANRFEKDGKIEVARAFYGHATSVFKESVGLWKQLVAFERRHGKIGCAMEMLEKGVSANRECDTLWLLLAKEAGKGGNGEAAREVLKRASEAVPESEDIWIAASRVEMEQREYGRGRELLQRARMVCGSGRVFMKSALLEREVGNAAGERRLICEGLDKFGNDEKLWLMLAQWLERKEAMNGYGNGVVNGHGNGKAKKEEEEVEVFDEEEEGKSEVWRVWNARRAYAKGVGACKKSGALWVGYCRLEERTGGGLGKARAIIEKGREQCEGTKTAEVVWRESVWLEVRAGNVEAAKNVLARGLQECKWSGLLWSTAVGLEGRKRQKGKSVDAIKACEKDALVVLEVAKYIWRTGKVEKAREWLQRSVALDDGRLGDAWATWLALEKEVGNAEGVKMVEERAQRAEPRYGDLWISVSKKVGNERLTCAQILKLVSAVANKSPLVMMVQRGVAAKTPQIH